MTRSRVYPSENMTMTMTTATTMFNILAMRAICNVWLHQQVAQELKLLPPDENYVNPNREDDDDDAMVGRHVVYGR